MEFSVLLSVYNKENPEYLKQALKSIMNQTALPSEVIIVKDGLLTPELDNVINDFLKEYPKVVKTVRLESNQGLGEALRIGMEYCSNEIVARADTDDINLPFRFQKQLDVLVKDSKIDVVGGWISEFETNSADSAFLRKVPLSFDEIKKKARYRNPMNHMTVMFRKSAVISAGNYKDFKWNEDYYLWVRMLLNGSIMINIPEVLVKVRAGKEMFRRRGGFKYIINEVRLQKAFLKLGFINLKDFIMSVILRSLIRIFPNSLRELVYKKILRSKIIF